MSIITVESACRQALSNFDFAKAATVYQALGWAWRDEGVPDEARIRATAEVLCKQLRGMEAPGRPCIASIGGLVVSLQDNGDGERVVCLELVVVSAASDALTPTYARAPRNPAGRDPSKEVTP